MTWTKVEDGLPERHQNCLVCAPSSRKGKPFINIAFYDYRDRRWILFDKYLTDTWAELVTHWMPIPDPPPLEEVYKE